MIGRSRTKSTVTSSGGGHKGRHISTTVATTMLLGLLGAFVVGAAPGGASVVAWSGALMIDSTPPPLVSLGTQESDSVMNLFTERTDDTLAKPLPVDITPNGNFPAKYDGIDSLTPSDVAAGTTIDSYFLKSEPVGPTRPGDYYAYSATITFSAPILGVMVTTGTLNDTNKDVGAIGTTYDLQAGAGLEDDGDSVELVGPSTIYVSLFTSNEMDCLRIITESTPSTGGSTSGSGGGSPTEPGYTEVASDGGIFNFGTGFYGSMGGQHLNEPMVGGAQVAGQLGYWTVASDGGIFSFGAAKFYGSMGGQHLNAPIVGMASTPDGLGYWLVASDGGIFSYGDAKFYGSRGGKHLNAPIVGMASTPDGLGYWLVASDGGIFSYGDAVFHGSTGGITLNKPVVGMAPTIDGLGYWLVASDGGIFSFGDAPFYGSMGGTHLNEPMIAMEPTADGLGYWTVASDGGVFSFGDATFLGSMGGRPLNEPVVGAF